MKKILPLIVILSLFTTKLQSQTGKAQVVRINATANANGTISLKWPAESWSGTFDIYRRALGNPDWGNAIKEKVTNIL